MIKTKRVEIRDSATFIPAIALQVTGGSDEPLLERAGFAEDPLVILIHLEGEGCHWDAFEWPTSSRTMHEAHRWLEQHWDEQEDSGVLDVEFVLGETKVPKVSSCLNPCRVTKADMNVCCKKTLQGFQDVLASSSKALMDIAGERKSVMEEAAFRRAEMLIDVMAMLKEYVGKVT